jgi:hypothetical protein
MKKYNVVLTKSYIVTVSTDTEKRAKRISEFYTSDIQDISTENDRRESNFSIEEIRCTVNEAFEVNEIPDD